MSETVKNGLITVVAGVLFCAAVMLLMHEVRMVMEAGRAYAVRDTVISEASR